MRPSGRSSSRDYHHGDLREALIEATFAQVDKAGYESVSIAALAKTLGVSQPAYVRHFDDKDALLTAVAVKSFHLFSTVLRNAVAGCQPGNRLRANALAYVRFGRERPGLYQLMFGSPLLSKASPESEIVLAARACFDQLLSALEGAARPRESVRDAVGVWASLHGIVQLERFHLLDGLRTKEVHVDTIVDDLLADPP
nr:TetR/AcrR family transcriptional regulator [Lichenifustis flavocetrariae]